MATKRLFDGFTSPGKNPRGAQDNARSLISPCTKKTRSDGYRVEVTSDPKFFNDPVHGQIELDMLCQRIVDTKQFQRLHKLKQLGCSDYVFRGATHTRFIHSLGVAHLAEKMARHFMKDEDLEIEEKDVLCVKIAGLAHDLGHGPFSHVFDGVFIAAMHPYCIDEDGNHWRHEDGSVAMLNYLLEDNNIVLSEYGLEEHDLLFIQEIIGGVKEEKRRGRPHSKFYLYDIVNNMRSGLDVDKLDYFLRDTKATNVPLQANFDRFITLAKVLPAEPIRGKVSVAIHAGGHSGAIVPRLSDTPSRSCSNSASASMPRMICYPEKMLQETMDIFSVRFKMHQSVYTHKTVKQIEFMVSEALKIANDHIFLEGNISEKFPTGKYKMSECIFDMRAFAQLNDSIVDIIKYQAAHIPELKEAVHLLDRIDRRELYTCLGKTAFSRGDETETMSLDEISDEIVAMSRSLEFSRLPPPTEVDDEFDSDMTYFGSVAAPLISAMVHDDGASRISLEGDGDGEVEYVSMSQQSTSSENGVTLEKDDIIVEKMHIHYGLKDKNPLTRMRFYAKDPVKTASARTVGREMGVEMFRSIVPAVFEDKEVRVFCKFRGKERVARRAFEAWCKRKGSHSPFPSASQHEELLTQEDL